MCIICGPRQRLRAEAVNPCLCGAPDTLRAMRRIEADISHRQTLGGADAMISQTSGHGDFRLRSDLPRVPGTPAGHDERQGVNAIADGADGVLRRAREQLMRGASQIEIHAGELLALSGPRAPYAGRLGVIAPGAIADLLVTDGDPERSLEWLDTPETSLRPIMKDGRVMRSAL